MSDVGSWAHEHEVYSLELVTIHVSQGSAYSPRKVT